MADRRNPQIVGGVILVVLGVALLIAQLVPGLGGEVVLPAIGVAFLVAYFYMRQYGFLVPGGILTGLGIGVVLQNRVQLGGVEIVVLGLGLGFLLIWVLDAVYTRFSNWWPLIPGTILVAVAVAPAIPQLGDLVERLWPVLLIAAGIALVIAALARRGREQ